MNKDWSAFKITFLLYAIVLLLPVNIYIAHLLSQAVEDDAFAIKQLRIVESAMQELALSQTAAQQKEHIASIEKRLTYIDESFVAKESNQFHIGFFNVQEEFSALSGCWGAYKNALLQQEMTPQLAENRKKCSKRVDKMTVVVEKMANIKQNRLLNALYLSLIVTMVIAMGVIYFVRSYMKKQLEKHALIDPLTQLFNRTYFMTEIEKASAIARRHEHALSMLFINIDDFKEVSHSEGPAKGDKILELFGQLILTLTRDSDIACRYSEDEFVIITPETDLKNAMTVAERIRKRVLKHEFEVQHPMTVSISVGRFHPKEDVENFLQRTVETLHEARKIRNRVMSAPVAN